jgi:O-antigen/teichoic acid export membrane protein
MSVIRNVAWMLAGRWVYNITTLISFTVIVSLITTADFGLYTLASTFIILSDTFFSDAVENLIVSHRGEDKYVVQPIFWTTVILSALIAVFVVL